MSPGYGQYFGLVESPFSLTSNTRFLFESASHSAALEQVTLALRRRETIAVITGEVGTGKTMLCRILVQGLEPRTFISVISNPLLTAEDLLKQLLHDFGLLSRDEARATSFTQHELVATLQRFIGSLVPLRAHAIILIDEAQHLSQRYRAGAPALELRERQSEAAADCAGRPARFGYGARSSRAAAAAAAHLASASAAPLKPYEVEQYVERRLWVAHGGLGLAKAGRAHELVSGDRFWRVRFTPSAMRVVAQLSHGLPRSINVICDRALEGAYGANKKVIDAQCVLTAARQLKLEVPVGVWLRSSRWPAVAASVALVGMAGWFACAPGRQPHQIQSSRPPRV